MNEQMLMASVNENADCREKLHETVQHNKYTNRKRAVPRSGHSGAQRRQGLRKGLEPRRLWGHPSLVYICII